MSIVSGLKQRFSGLFGLFGDDEPKNIGIYGPPNTGKTTFANRIISDWTDESDVVESNTDEDVDDNVDEESEGNEFGGSSHIPHETRRAERKKVTIEKDGKSVELDVVDTPGVATQVDYQEFIDYDMEEDEAIERSREATEGIAEAMHWLREDIDGVIYVLDSTQDPFTQVNTTLLGIIESRDLPVLVLANKIDLEDASVQRIENAFPQHTIVEISALEGNNVEEAYSKIAEHFG